MINVDGSVIDIKVVKSNMIDILNYVVLEVIKSVAYLFFKLDEIVYLKIFIVYSLKED